MVAWHPDYLSKTDPRALIVYGPAADAGRILSELGADGPSTPLSEDHAVFTPSAPGFRLSSRGWVDMGPDVRMDLPDADTLMLLCRGQVHRSAPQFAMSIRRFLDEYLDFCRAQVDVHRDELQPATPDIYGHADWVFSAWLPLPHARVLLPPSFEGEGPAFAEIDIAFWDGTELIAVMLEDGGTPLKSARRRRDHLFETFPALRVVKAGRDGAFPMNAFPESLTRFWSGLEMPTGPCPPSIAWP